MQFIKKFGFGDKFISWIHLLYSSPKASVHTNDVYSDYFALGRGCRQGLSFITFALCHRYRASVYYIKIFPLIQRNHPVMELNINYRCMRMICYCI